MAAWRLARSLETLRTQINAAAPNRGKSSDGTVGDLRHQAGASDHNPNSSNVVTAADFTHDPAHGFNSWDFADMLLKRRDPRIKYVISKGRIFSSVTSPWQWRKYTGPNSHTHHVHVSVSGGASLYDDSKAWDIGGDWNAGKDEPASPPARPILKQGSSGEAVKKLQADLGMPEKERDGAFGPKTKAAVVAFQKAHGLAADGVVGPYTYDALAK